MTARRTAARKPRAPLSEITRSALLNVIARYDEIGEKDFFAWLRQEARKVGQKPVTPGRRYFIKIGDRLYHSKAVIAAAMEHTAIGRPLGNKEFSGGVARLANILRRCELPLWDEQDGVEV